MDLIKLGDGRQDPKWLWQNDPLKRQSQAEKITRIIRTVKDPFVISLSAPWGTGKTEFIRMWEYALQEGHIDGEKHACLCFNAWKNDFSGEPIKAFVGELTALAGRILANEISKPTEIKNSLQKTSESAFRLARAAFPTILKGVIKKTTGVAVEELFTEEIDGETRRIAQETFGEAADKVSSQYIAEYLSRKETVNQFKASLGDLAETIFSIGYSKPLMVFVDELDRCRPDYAIELLESIKHLFDIENLIFILSIDKEQLENAVRALYGPQINTSCYLQKFIDVEFKLKIPDRTNFTSYIYSQFRIDEFLNTWPRQKQANAIGICGLFTQLSDKYKLNYREQAQILSRINLSFRLQAKEKSLRYVETLFLHFAREKCEEAYSIFFYQNHKITIGKHAVVDSFLSGIAQEYANYMGAIYEIQVNGSMECHQKIRNILYNGYDPRQDVHYLYKVMEKELVQLPNGEARPFQYLKDIIEI